MKSELAALVCDELRVRLDRLAKAAMAAHAAATDPGSKAESKYDTRSLEESYLASGQARQVKELAETLRAFENVRLRDFQKHEPIEAGALVSLRRKGSPEEIRFLLAPSAGGLEVVFQNQEITLLSPESPLYGKLVGLSKGESLDEPPFKVTSVS
jgi:hypothetical protein